MMRQALGQIDQQAVILGIPARSCLEVNCNRESAHAGSKRACLNGRAIDVFLPTAALRAKSGHLGGWVRLIHVKEATEMDAADVETADAYCCIGERIEFDCSAGLNAIRVLMVLIEANHYGRSKKSTVSDRSTTRERIRKWIRCIVRISPVFDQSLEPKSGDRGRTGESKEFRLGVEIVLERAAGIFADGSTARRKLAGEERRGNNSVEQAKASANDKVALGPKIISNTQPGVEVLPLSIEDAAGPGLPLPANPAVQCQTACRAPFDIERRDSLGVGDLAQRRPQYS